MLTLLANYINHVQAFDLIRPELKRLFQAQRVYRLSLPSTTRTSSIIPTPWRSNSRCYPPLRTS
jgi:hypothetical protein